MRKRAMVTETAAFILFLCSMTGCESESYDAGDGRYSLTRADFVDVHSVSKGTADYVLTDSGDSLSVTNPSFVFSGVEKGDTIYRGVLYYNNIDGGAEVISYSAVSVLDIYTTDRVKEMKTDPVRFESVWKSASGRYLNLSLYVMTGVADGSTSRQSIGMVSSAGGDTLTFFHNQNGAPEYYSSKLYISLRTRDLPLSPFLLRVNTYDGWEERVISGVGVEAPQLSPHEPAVSPSRHGDKDTL